MPLFVPIEDTAQLPTLGDPETEQLDFKRDWPANDNIEIAFDIAQFSNQLGGSIIVGADAPQARLAGYVGVADVHRLTARVRDVASDRIVPRPQIDIRDLPLPDGKRVLVVNVRPSVSITAVRCVDHPGYAFPIRRLDARVFLRFEEVERMFSPARRARLLVEQIPSALRENVVFDAKGATETGLGGWKILRTEENQFTIRSPGGQEINVPYEFVEAAWTFGANQCAITIDAEVVPLGGKLYVLRYPYRTSRPR